MDTSRKMASLRAISTLALLLNWVCLCSAETVTIWSSNKQIRYVKGNNPNNTIPTWVSINASPSNCPTTQGSTERVGDYAVFTFTGTEITLFGTLGSKRGIIGFSLDGQNSTFDRTKSTLECNHAMFHRTNLTLQQHTLITTLLQKQPSLDKGPDTGALSIQRIIYTVPDAKSSASTNSPSLTSTSTTETNARQTDVSQNKTSNNNLPAIIGGSVGGGVAILLAIGLFVFCRRKRRAKARNDHDSLPSLGYMPSSVRGNTHQRLSPSPIIRTAGRGASQRDYSESMEKTPQSSWERHQQASQRLPEPIHSPAHPVRHQGLGFPLASTSRSDRRRGSLSSSSGSASDYFANNRQRSGSMYSEPTTYHGDDSLADKGAMRMANMKQSKAVTSPTYTPPLIYGTKKEGANLQDERNRNFSPSSQYSDLPDSSNVVNTRSQRPPVGFPSVATAPREEDTWHLQSEKYLRDPHRVSLSDHPTPESTHRRLPSKSTRPPGSRSR